MNNEINELIRIIELVNKYGGNATILDGSTGKEVTIEELKAKLDRLNKEVDDNIDRYDEAIRTKAEGPIKAMEVDRKLVIELLKKYDNNAKKVLKTYSTIEREGLNNLLIGSGVPNNIANIISFASILGFVQNLVTNANVESQYNEIIETFEEIIKEYKK